MNESTINLDGIANATSIATKACLVRLRIRKPSASKKDQSLTDLYNARNGEVDAGYWSSKYFSQSPRWKAMNNALNAVYRFNRQETLPWTDDGERALPMAAHPAYMAGITPLIDMANVHIKDFFDHYEEEVDADLMHKHSTGDRSKYPTAEEIREKISVSVKFLPITTGRDWRVDVGEAEAALLEKEINSALGNAKDYMLGTIAKGMMDLVEKIDTYGDGEGKRWHGSLVTNLQDAVNRIAKLNVGDDPDVNALVTAVDGVLDKHSPAPDSMKHSEGARSEAKEELNNLLANLGL